MNLWLRMFRIWIAARNGPPLAAEDVSVIRLRVWPHDLDLWGHVNGGRYLTMSDLGRLDFSVRTGLFALVRRQGWTMPMAAAALRFKRPVRLFEACELRTRVLGWDDRWGYLETIFTRDGRVVATVIAKATVRDGTRTVQPKVLLELLGAHREPVPVPEYIRRWVEAEPTMGVAT